MPDTPEPQHASTELEQIVEQWFFEAFHGSVVARTTEAWNLVHAAKEDLKERLRSCLDHLPSI